MERRMNLEQNEKGEKWKEADGKKEYRWRGVG